MLGSSRCDCARSHSNSHFLLRLAGGRVSGDVRAARNTARASRSVVWENASTLGDFATLAHATARRIHGEDPSPFAPCGQTAGKNRKPSQLPYRGDKKGTFLPLLYKDIRSGGQWICNVTWPDGRHEFMYVFPDMVAGLPEARLQDTDYSNGLPSGWAAMSWRERQDDLADEIVKVMPANLSTGALSNKSTGKGGTLTKMRGKSIHEPGLRRGDAYVGLAGTMGAQTAPVGASSPPYRRVSWRNWQHPVCAELRKKIGVFAQILWEAVRDTPEFKTAEMEYLVGIPGLAVFNGTPWTLITIVYYSCCSSRDKAEHQDLKNLKGSTQCVLVLGLFESGGEVEYRVGGGLVVVCECSAGTIFAGKWRRTSQIDNHI